MRLTGEEMRLLLISRWRGGEILEGCRSCCPSSVNGDVGNSTRRSEDDRGKGCRFGGAADGKGWDMSSEEWWRTGVEWPANAMRRCEMCERRARRSSGCSARGQEGSAISHKVSPSYYWLCSASATQRPSELGISVMRRGCQRAPCAAGARRALQHCSGCCTGRGCYRKLSCSFPRPRSGLSLSIWCDDAL